MDFQECIVGTSDSSDSGSRKFKPCNPLMNIHPPNFYTDGCEFDDNWCFDVCNWFLLEMVIFKINSIKKALGFGSTKPGKQVNHHIHTS